MSPFRSGRAADRIRWPNPAIRPGPIIWKGVRVLTRKDRSALSRERMQFVAMIARFIIEALKIIYGGLIGPGGPG